MECEMSNKSYAQFQKKGRGTIKRKNNEHYISLEMHSGNLAIFVPLELYKIISICFSQCSFEYALYCGYGFAYLTQNCL